MSKMARDPSSKSFEQVTSAYARDLEAHFGAFGSLVPHAGEIGRAHEAILKAVLSKLIPPVCRAGSGFIRSSTACSPQQDVLIYRTDLTPPLYEVGDCVVVEPESAVGLIEVKTRLDKVKDLAVAVKRLDAATKIGFGPGFEGIFFWKGLSLKSVMTWVWSEVAKCRLPQTPTLPKFIYKYGEYLLIKHENGDCRTPPYLLVDTKKGPNGAGRALQALLSMMWYWRFQNICPHPWWLFELEEVWAHADDLPNFMKLRGEWLADAERYYREVTGNGT